MQKSFEFLFGATPVLPQTKKQHRAQRSEVDFYNFFKELNGAPKRNRTSDPQIRSLMLYPAELWARDASESHRAFSAVANKQGCV